MRKQISTTKMAEEQQESSQGEMEGERTSYKTECQMSSAAIDHARGARSPKTVPSLLRAPGFPSSKAADMQRSEATASGLTFASYHCYTKKKIACLLSDTETASDSPGALDVREC